MVEESGVKPNRTPAPPPVQNPTSWQQLARTSTQMRETTNAWQSLGRTSTSDVPPSAPPLGAKFPPASGAQPGLPKQPLDVVMDDNWEEDDWDCPGDGWDFDFELDDALPDPLGDEWCERPSPHKRGRDAVEVAPREGIDQAMQELRAENARLRNQVDELLKRIDQMCSLMQTQTPSHATPPTPGPGHLRETPALLPGTVLSTAQPVSAESQVEQVAPHLYQVTPQGEYITFPEWQPDRTLEEGQLAAVFRLPWHLTKREAAGMSWKR
eukprot:6457542-Amphidinium_carterae.1